MVLAHHGKRVTLEELRRSLGTTRDGVAAVDLVRLARRHGLRAQGLQVQLEDLRYLARATILHWKFSHFVVLERVRKDRLEIVDPGRGRREVAMSEVKVAFTGVALAFEMGEEFTRSAGRPSRVVSYLRAVVAQRGLWTHILLASLMLQALGLLLPVLSGSLVDRVIPRQDYSLLYLLAVVLAGVTLFQFLVGLVRGNLMLTLATSLEMRLMSHFIEHLVALPYRFFQRRSNGDLISRFNANSTIREILTAGVLAALLDGPLLLVQLGFLFFISPMMGAVVLLLGGLQITVIVFFRRRKQELTAQALQVQGELSSCQVDLLGGIETVKAMGLEDAALERWSGIFVESLNVSLRRGRLNNLQEASVGAMQLAWPFVTLGLGAALVLEGRRTLGDMLVLNTVAAAILGRMAGLVRTAAQLQYVSSHSQRLDDVFDAKPENHGHRRPAMNALAGRIQIQSVSFRYGPRSPFVVRDISFDVAPGELIGIVGASGSGKSTLGKLIIGLYRATKGQVLFDGQDLAAVDPRSVRSQLGVVPQVPYVFAGSIMANIAVADPTADRAAIEQASRMAQLHDEIVAMPLGYDTPLTDGGSSLSGGQRQRLAIARALLRRPAVLVLDEATSALDVARERQLQQQLASLACTRIVIAHRLSSVVEADRILVLDRGRLVESGSHARLMETAGAYARLVAIQAPRMPVEGIMPRQVQG
jgi:ATP-binding cassette subfamily B protein